MSSGLINATMGFPKSHQPRSYVTPKILRMGFRYPKLWFFA